MASDVVIGDSEVDRSRRVFLTAATATTGAIGVALAVVPFAASWLPSERARAFGAPVALDLSKLDRGQMVVVIWRKQPVYVVRRTPVMLASLSLIHISEPTRLGMIS